MSEPEARGADLAEERADRGTREYATRERHASRPGTGVQAGTREPLEWLNALPAGDAERELLACCGSQAWAGSVAAGRPYRDAAALKNACDRAFNALTWADVEEALARHPRIGDRPRGVDRASGWSRGEQAGVQGADRQVMRALHDGNLAYEERFGHVFLVCATGLTARRMLAALRERLGNDEAAERRTVRGELLKITHLRLDKLLERP
ncbi:2-oxo-4-hydroxy-4-carboxy-5-ureidoimidazoline decarboxylase [Thermomonospora echinospora]|uniref:2-oxo-4-hydroxy-4-carboxy-5-ureidoimidazoline decarboxylase n=1 Tax=Thermomonospora echinospora TaxID=1992 RepID=A0A1H6BD55_9ACTN|nr:2-oxo-4-hydroxy-4-carboxy-5-ureidoimidazoline decarboxylase [Thermomonospora echinospora]SEG58590.1 2-oxo-4-hydroxy-4-carboxy-5-ureidoimidazoline decarboxylase [Thermomonospora echinospora]